MQMLGHITPTTEDGQRRLLQVLFELEALPSWDMDSPLARAMINVLDAQLGTSFQRQVFDV
jgi:hypothetical protein